MGTSKMTIQPIFPIGLLLLGFLAVLGCTVFFSVRSGLKTSENIFMILRLSVIYLLVLIIGLRPVKVATDYEFSTKNLDVLFVVDSTISMWAQDYNGNYPRMDGVKKDVNYILGELAGSNFGLVTFDDTSHVLSPFTQDIKYIEDLFDIIAVPEATYALGSNLSVPYSDMKALLESSRKKENRKTIVFYISDGEVTSGKEVTSFAGLTSLVDSGAVLGYGSLEGGKMKDGYNYIYDYDAHSDAISKIDETNLKKIADELEIQYLNLNGTDSALEGMIEIIKQQSATIVEKGFGAERYIDTYFYFAIALAAMIMMELYIFIRRGRL